MTNALFRGRIVDALIQNITALSTDLLGCLQAATNREVSHRKEKKSNNLFDYDHEDKYGKLISPPRRTPQQEAQLKEELDRELDLLAQGIQAFVPDTDEGREKISLGWYPLSYINSDEEYYEREKRIIIRFDSQGQIARL